MNNTVNVIQPVIEQTMSDSSNHNYLFELPKLLNDAAYAVHNKIQSPMEMIISSILAAMSSSCQGFLDVKAPDGRICPTSLFMITSSPSGERKSATDKTVNAVFEKFEHQQMVMDNEQVCVLKAREKVWLTKKTKLDKSLKAACKQGDEDLMQQIAVEIVQLEQTQPTAFKEYVLVCNDSTIESLFSILDNNPAILMNSSEGAVLFSKLNSTSLAHLNGIWSGDTVRVDRKTEDTRLVINNARVCMSIMVQPEFLQQLLNKGDGIAMSSGFLARALIVEPKSTQGSRFYNSHQDESSKASIAAFEQRITELLTYGQSLNGNRIVAHLEQDAICLWANFYNEIEFALCENGRLSDISGFASKIPENTLRIAALIQFFCYGTLEVGFEAMRSAINLAKFYTVEFKQLFGVRTEFERQQEYGKILYDWLARKYAQTGCVSHYLADIPKIAPKIIRKKENLNLALMELQSKGVIQISNLPKQNYLNINLNCFAPSQFAR